jgi:predicted metal-dependent hydrolase
MNTNDCAGSLPSLVMRGIEEFNRDEFFEQHESLEAAWRAEPRPVRELYQGILQVGVACYQIERGNLPGALKMFERGLRRLHQFTPECLGIDVSRLIAEAEHVRDEAQRIGPERLDELDRSLFPRITVGESTRSA